MTGEAAGQVTIEREGSVAVVAISSPDVRNHFTRRLWAWREEWGSKAAWARQLGEWAIAAGSVARWPRVSTGLVAA